MAVSVFKEINKQYPGLGIIVTGGNDAYHQNLNSNSIHKVGNGIDFTINEVTNGLIYRNQQNIKRICC
jgi:hypothetical protein